MAQKRLSSKESLFSTVIICPVIIAKIHFPLLCHGTPGFQFFYFPTAQDNADYEKNQHYR